MANYDAEVRVGTKVDTSQMQKLQTQIDKATHKVSELAAKHEELKTKNVPTKQFAELENKLEAAKAKLQGLVAEEQKFLDAGIAIGAPWDNVLEKEAEAQLEIEAITEEMQKLKEEGKAFTIGDQDEIEKAAYNLRIAQQELGALNKRKEELIAKEIRSANGFKRMEKSAKKAFNATSSGAKKSGGLLSTLGSRFKGIALSLLIFNQITKAFNAMVSGMKEGYKNLAQYSDAYNESASELKSANTQLKNSFATAFGPIIQMVIPYLIQLINYLITAMNYVAQFTATLSGQSTWTKAKKVQEDYADSLNGTASAAKKAAGALASFDSLEVLSKNEDTGGDNSGTKPEDMFEEVPIDSDFLSTMDLLKERTQELKDLFVEGFENGFKTDSLDDLQNNLVRIKDGLMTIWNNPEVQQAQEDFVNQTATMLGTIAGASASIGVSLADGVTGGIAQALEDENLQEFASEKITQTFEHLTDAEKYLTDFAEAAAEVGTAFESQGFKDCVEFFAKLGAYVNLEYLEKITGFFEDVIGFFTSPFTENADKIKKTLENIFDLASNLLQPAEDLIDLLMNNSTNYDDTALHKFMEKLTSDKVDAVSDALDGWNVLLEKLIDLTDDLSLESLAMGIDEFLPSKEDFETFIDENVKPVFTKEYWEGVLYQAGEAIANLIYNIGPQWDEKIKAWFEEYVQPWFTKDKWIETAAGLKEGIVEKLSQMKEEWGTKIEEWWKENVEPWFTKEQWQKLGTNLKEGIYNGFKGVVNKVIDILNKVLSGFEDMVNGAIELVNKFIDGYNSVASAFGGNGLTPFPTITINKIPYPQLANGAVIRGGNPFTAVLGDQPSGQTNIETPLHTMIEAFDTALDRRGGGPGNRPAVINLIVNGEVAARALIPDLLSELDREGYDIDLLGGLT